MPFDTNKHNLNKQHAVAANCPRTEDLWNMEDAVMKFRLLAVLILMGTCAAAQSLHERETFHGFNNARTVL